MAIDYIYESPDGGKTVTRRKFGEREKEVILTEKDVIGRVGGEEFAILMPETTKAGALLLCERIQEKLAEHTFGPQRAAFKVTLSMGLVESTYVCPEDLLHQADNLLYLAKTNGRNKIISAEMMDIINDRQDFISESGVTPVAKEKLSVPLV